MTGRFINADGQLNEKEGVLGYNLFAYCGNNPVMRIDPTGKSFWDDLIDFGKNLFEAAVDAIVVIGTAAAIVGTAAFIVGTGGAGALAVGAAAAISAAETAALAATATAAVGITAVAAGEIGSNIQQAKAKKGNSTYDKDGIRVDYEPYGTGKGNVHVHHDGIKEHVFRKTPTESIREPISKGLEKIIGNNKKVFTAIEKAIRFVEELCK